MLSQLHSFTLILVHQAVDELLAARADPNLPLASQVGSALCASANIHYNPGPRLHNRIKLVLPYNITLCTGIICLY